jgi:hypothetical protein
MNTIYELADKIHGLLERAGSALRHHRALRGYAAPLKSESTGMPHSLSSHSGM